MGRVGRCLMLGVSVLDFWFGDYDDLCQFPFSKESYICKGLSELSCKEV
jgi:hypothetical protein